MEYLYIILSNFPVLPIDTDSVLDYYPFCKLTILRIT